jgi:hypothetical protein
MIVGWIIGVVAMVFLAFYMVKFIWYLGTFFKRTNNDKK